jgi:hypothetical protein
VNANSLQLRFLDNLGRVPKTIELKVLDFIFGLILNAVHSQSLRLQVDSTKLTYQYFNKILFRFANKCNSNLAMSCCTKHDPGNRPCKRLQINNSCELIEMSIKLCIIILNSL